MLMKTTEGRFKMKATNQKTKTNSANVEEIVNAAREKQEVI